MGDFTWHTSDPDHAVIDLGPRRKTLAPFDAPVYLLAPNGQKWREDDYEGGGVFGGAVAGAEMARWNLGIRLLKGKTDEELRRRTIDISLWPYGSAWTKPPVFPLKFSRNPEAVYDELPAAIPAADTVKCYDIDHFDILTVAGDRINTSETRRTFWLSRAEELGIFAEDDQAPSEDVAWNWIGQIFWDNPEELPLPKGARLAYVGYKISLHQMVHELSVGKNHHWSNPARWRTFVEEMSVARAENLAEVFDAGLREGVRDYDRAFIQQLARYESGQPLSTELIHDRDESLNVMWWDARRQGSPSDRQVHTLGRIVGADSRAWQCSMERNELRTVENPLRVALQRV